MDKSIIEFLENYKPTSEPEDNVKDSPLNITKPFYCIMDSFGVEDPHEYLSRNYHLINCVKCLRIIHPFF